MFKPNTLFYSDGYKVGHKRMLAPNTDYLAGSWIPRSLKHAPVGVTKITSFGEQLTWKWLHDEFEENFFFTEARNSCNSLLVEGFKENLKNKAMRFASDMSLYLGLPYDGTHFGELWDLGYLPIKVKALPEGLETGPNIPHMTFINTVKGFAWLTLYLETIVSSLAWKPSTSATISTQYLRNATEWVNKTDPDNAWLIPFLCHDFSARGLSPWDMLSSGLGHAVSFRGSDTLIVIPGARYFYGESEDEVCINSVNASEHSVSTTKIFTVGEKQMIIDWLIEFPTGILSIVADTFDLWKLLLEYVADPEVKALIMARDGKLVIRPDSGNPVDIICGKSVLFTKELTKENVYSFISGKAKHEFFHKDGKYYKGSFAGFGNLDCEWEEITNITPDIRGVINILWDTFGGKVNAQGYKVLDPHIGAIYGDSINLERQVTIYKRLATLGFAATNIVLGVGSYTYQYNTRDTLGFAAKGIWFENNGTGIDIYKDPVTDDGTKKSLKGLLCVVENGLGEIICETQCTKERESQGLLQVIYQDGHFFNQTTLTEVRERVAANVRNTIKVSVHS